MHRLSATVIDIPDHEVVLRDEWMVATPHGLDTRWTLRGEVAALCYYAKLCGGDIVEIGCNEGNTTAALAFNNPDRRIYAVDWPGSPSSMVPEQHGEKPAVPGKFAQGFSNVQIIEADSATLSYDPAWNVRMVFIDGGHHYAQVKCDTEKAIDYLQRHSGGYVLWHDYGNDRPNWVEVAPYLEREIAPCYDLYAVRNTALALIRVEPAAQERARIRSKITALQRECATHDRQLDAAHEAVGRLQTENAALQVRLHRWIALRNSPLGTVLRRIKPIVRASQRVLRVAVERANPAAARSHAIERSHDRSTQRVLDRLRQAKAGYGS
jgi:hypothetical protein